MKVRFYKPIEERLLTVAVSGATSGGNGVCWKENGYSAGIRIGIHWNVLADIGKDGRRYWILPSVNSRRRPAP